MIVLTSGNLLDLLMKRFLFFAGNDFHLITYFCCLNNSNKYQFRIGIIEHLVKNIQKLNIYEIKKIRDPFKVLKDFRIKNKSLKKVIYQVNFTYPQNCGVVSKIDFLDAFFNQEKLTENYNKAKEYLINNEYEYLLDELDTLYKHNKMYFYNSDELEYETCKTIDAVIKQINKQLNN